MKQALDVRGNLISVLPAGLGVIYMRHIHTYIHTYTYVRTHMYVNMPYERN